MFIKIVTWGNQAKITNIKLFPYLKTNQKHLRFLEENIITKVEFTPVEFHQIGARWKLEKLNRFINQDFFAKFTKKII